MSTAIQAACLLGMSRPLHAVAVAAPRWQTPPAFGLESIAQRTGFSQHCGHNDADSFMVLVTTDVVLMPPNQPGLKGKAAVRAWYDQFLAQLRTSDLIITDREVLIGGEWATELATFEWVVAPVGGGPAVTDRGQLRASLAP